MSTQDTLYGEEEVGTLSGENSSLFRYELLRIVSHDAYPSMVHFEGEELFRPGPIMAKRVPYRLCFSASRRRIGERGSLDEALTLIVMS